MHKIKLSVGRLRNLRSERRRARAIKSLFVRRSVVIAGHKKSITLEEEFWTSLIEIARCQNMILATLLAKIDSERYRGSLSSAIRLFVANFYREQFEFQERGKMIPEAIWHPVRLH
jgi:predicted DNA-binding ribbon-helix-helix protein